MKKIDYLIIGERLRKLRKYLGLTEEDVADIIKIKIEEIDRIEKGESIIDIEVLKNFSKLYSISVDDLCDDNERNFSNKDMREIDSLIEYMNLINK